jgi:AcrR family transcriptional regulator
VKAKLERKMVTTGAADRPGGDGAPRRTRLRAAQRRETILRAAAEVFAEAGYRPAKVSEIAARVGVTEPVIFQNFGSKAALYAAVLERAAAEVRESLDTMTEGTGQQAELLAHLLTGPAHGQPGQPTTGPGSGHADADHPGAAYGVLFADAVTLTGEPELTGPARDAVRAVAAHLADLIRHTWDGGSARPAADPEAAAWLLLSVLSARRLRAAAMPPGLEPAVTALTLQALVPPGALRHDKAPGTPDDPGPTA